mgnify:CR=1 FL=1
MRKKLVEALKDKYRADYSTAHASLEIYMTNPVGIGAVSYTHLRAHETS